MPLVKTYEMKTQKICLKGHILPGILIIKPDFPENKEYWPFLWGENEYVVSLGSDYIFLVNAANDLLRQIE